MTQTQIDYAALGQTEQEAALLRKHDEDETLHAFVQNPIVTYLCAECGDTEDGLMHNNVWRNVEPLLCDIDVTDHADKYTPEGIADACWGAECSLHGELLDGDWFDRATIDRAVEAHLTQTQQGETSH
ncbi:MAG: hypothetical protein ABIQ39_02615 [Ilumatobacteraceae bacterium]